MERGEKTLNCNARSIMDHLMYQCGAATISLSSPDLDTWSVNWCVLKEMGHLIFKTIHHKWLNDPATIEIYPSLQKYTEVFTLNWTSITKTKISLAASSIY